MTTGATKHLFVVVTGVNQIGTQLIVNFSSVKEDISYDNACIVHPGSHRFIKKLSYIEYRHAQIQLQDDLDRGLKIGKFISDEPVTPSLLQQICNGFARSEFCARKHQNFFNNYKHLP